MTDDEWVARARGRVAAGGAWQTPDEEFSVSDPAAAAIPASVHAIVCPQCGDQSELYQFDGEGPPEGSWRYCQRCDGVWVTRDGLSLPVAVTADAPEAFLTTAMTSPDEARCRACLGALDPKGDCRNCGATARLLKCPTCAVEMGRTQTGGVTVDICPTCGGTWFDVGEVATVYGLKPELDPATKVRRMRPFAPYSLVRGGGGIIYLLVNLTRGILG